MILGAEIAMLVMGFYALITGKFPTNKKAKYVLQGWPVRLIGMICLLPIPGSFLAGVVLAIWWVAQGKDVTDRSFFWAGTAIEGSVLAACLLAITIVSRVNRIPVEGSQAETHT